MEHLTEEICFKKSPPKQTILITYEEISRIITEQFHLPLPAWWLRKFPLP
jgi:hypothetical protein